MSKMFSVVATTWKQLNSLNSHVVLIMRSSMFNRSRPYTGAIHSTKISGNFGPKLNGSVRSNGKSFEKTGPTFEVELWLNCGWVDRARSP